MSHFRDRVILAPGNIPQLPSGLVTFTIGAYRISAPVTVLPANICPVQAGAPTMDLAAVNTYTISAPSVDLASLIPTQTKTATSP